MGKEWYLHPWRVSEGTEAMQVKPATTEISRTIGMDAHLRKLAKSKVTYATGQPGGKGLLKAVTV